MLPVLSGCVPFGAYWGVARGNYSYNQGHYQKAAIEYLSLQQEPGYARYLAYNLGNVYYALGELSAAESQWEKSRETTDEELLFRSLYNQGNVYYARGEYQEAFRSFKRALLIKPEDRKAKINLEHSLKKLRGRPSGGSSAAASAGGESGGSEVERIMDFIRRREPSLWKNPDIVVGETDERDW